MQYLVMSHVGLRAVKQAFKLQSVRVSIGDDIANLPHYRGKNKHSYQVAYYCEHVSVNRSYRNKLGEILMVKMMVHGCPKLSQLMLLVDKYRQKNHDPKQHEFSDTNYLYNEHLFLRWDAICILCMQLCGYIDWLISMEKSHITINIPLKLIKVVLGYSLVNFLKY